LNFDDPKYLYFIIEYVQGGELFTLLRTRGSFPLEQAKFYIAHIITIFEYLHGKNIIYRDLKPENILINKNGYLKLTDFGFAKYLDNEKTYTLCGTPEYLAPEIILNKGHGKPVDWWTMGILLYEMLVGIDPFSDDDPMKTYQKIIKGKINFPKDFDKNAKSLVKHLLTADTTKRYGCLKNGVKDILNHRLFIGYDWKNFVFLKMEPPYIPPIKSATDSSNFESYPDSDVESPSVDKNEDPFLKW
jgi:serine/threonine protein kinase